MAKKGGAYQEKPESPSLRVPRSEAETKICAQIDKGRQLLEDHQNGRLDDDSAKTKVEQWEKYNDTLLKSLFSTHLLAKELDDAILRVDSQFSGDDSMIRAFSGDPDPRQGKNQQDEEVKACITKLESIIERLELYQEPEGSVSSKRPEQPTTELGPDVFLVYGHDEAAKHEVARFLEKLQLKPVILDEKPKASRTIIEQIEEHANVGFAVVLMTPDDVGAAIEDKEHLKPRARQNVILELGFFMGKLDRKHVCILYKGGVEKPSDYDGVLHVSMDNKDAWQLQLARELQNAGLPIDPGKLI